MEVKLRSQWPYVNEPDSLAAEILETEVAYQRGDKQQSGIGHQIRIIKNQGDRQFRAILAYRKCLLDVEETMPSSTVISPPGMAFPQTCGPSISYRGGASRLEVKRKRR